MTEQQKELIAMLRESARRNYEKDGWDFLIECWDDADILEEIGRCTTFRGAWHKCHKAVRLQDERRREISSSESW